MSRAEYNRARSERTKTARAAKKAEAATPDLAWVRLKYKSYGFRDRSSKCFYCGGHAHHTGYLPDLGPIWLCKTKCASKYKNSVTLLRGNDDARSVLQLRGLLVQ